MLNRIRLVLIRYGMAFLALGLALLFGGFREQIGDATPFLLAFTIVLVVAWYGGLWPGLATALVSALAVGYLIFLDRRFLDQEIADELGHARLLEHKIVALGGTPTTRPAEVRLGASNREIFEIVLQAERDTIERYTQRLKQADAAGEVGLRVDLEDIISDETRHRDDLELILRNWRE